VLLSRDRLPNDDAHRRPGSNDVGQFEAAALEKVIKFLARSFQCRILYHHIQIRELSLWAFIWRADYPLDHEKSRFRRHSAAASAQLKIARRPQDADVIAADLQRGKRMGLDVEQISPDIACRLNPFLKPSGVITALRIGDDRYFDPAQVAVGFARGAQTKGAILLPKTDVTEVIIEGGKVTGVQTTKGPVQASVVVDAAGAWTRQVAKASDIRVPLVPTRQQLIVTEALEGARADLPMVRIMDAAIYIRPCQGGFLWGVYEEAPRFFDMKVLGPAFDVKDMPLDIEVLRRAAEEVKAQLLFYRRRRRASSVGAYQP
jgi:glycine/D-amino acid oxidase-like deaminating enzyme